MAWLRTTASWLDARRRSLVLLLGWVAVLVVASGRATDDDRWLAVPDGSDALAVFLLLAAAVGFAYLLVLRPRLVAEGAGERKRGSVLAMLLTFVVLVVVALVVFGPREPEDPVAESEPAGPEVAPAFDGDDSTVTADVDNGSVLIIVLLATAAAAVLAWSRRGAAAGPPTAERSAPDRLESELSIVLEQAARLLGDDRDPRAGVLRAYAMLEETCSSHGVRRRPSETPSEHLTRALGRFPETAEPAQRLGRLYELARFSEAPITEDDRQVAVAALDRAHQRLAPRLGAT